MLALSHYIWGWCVTQHEITETDISEWQWGLQIWGLSLEKLPGGSMEKGLKKAEAGGTRRLGGPCLSGYQWEMEKTAWNLPRG